MQTNQRAVKLRTAVSAPPTTGDALATDQQVHLSFVAMGDRLPTALDYGIQNQEQAARLNQALLYLKSLDETFFQWLEADAAHTILFANQPLQALRTVFPDVDQSLNLPANLFSSPP
ncbi:hypothetical protein [Fibrella aquatica]|uniref:hypothetical protein n=1 Tax=Fibrella aquatica TaxID=3242487 RepID=UPI003520931D